MTDTTTAAKAAINHEPMNEHYVTIEHLKQMQQIAHVSSAEPGKDVWTELGVYYRPRYNRPFVAVVIGGTSRPGFVPRMRFMTAGTLSRAMAWFEGSNLTDRLYADVPPDAAHRYPSSDEVVAEEAAVRRAVRDAIDDGVLAGFEKVKRRVDKSFGLRVVGITTDRLADVLEWLYPDAKTGRARLFERDFGIPTRTVQHALSIEAGDTTGKPGAWVGMLLKTMQCFDRELWAAGHATIAQVEG